jgi:hypothetical protein
MPATRTRNRDLARATRELMKHRPDATYTACRAELVEFLDGTDYTPAEAVRIMTDPANELLCETCGWTAGMTCPECAGCGCSEGCTGWRHQEYA